MAIFSKSTISQREFTRRIKGLCECRRLGGVKLPVGTTIFVLGAKKAQRLLGSPGIVVVQTVAEEERKLEQA